MSRLIEAGKILDNLSGMLKNMDDYDAVKKVINDMPTAYDVDAVVKQLDEYITKIVGRKSALYQTVMQIVKGGGVDDNPNSNNDYRPDM
jgi:hypothetical protein